MLLIQSTPIEVRQLNVDDFRMDLNALQASEDGIWADTTHIHYAPVNVAGVDLAMVIQIINDYTVTFENGAYAVNIVGGNSNIADVVNINNVSVRTANSAGLMDIQYMQAGAFGGGVAYKPSSIYSGTTFPVGTRGYPVNNDADLKVILTERGLSNVFVMESVLLDSSVDFSGLAITFIGDNRASTNVDIDAAVNITNCQFQRMTVQGILDGNNVFTDCRMGDVLYLNGLMVDCELSGLILLGGGLSHFHNCFSSDVDTGSGQYPTINMGTSGNQLHVNNFSGALAIINASGVSDVSSIYMTSGTVVFDSTVTAGEFVIRGIGEVEANGATATVLDYTVSKEVERARKLLSNRQELVDRGTDVVLRTYEDDGVTVFEESVVTDKDGNKPNLEGIAKRGVPG